MSAELETKNVNEGQFAKIVGWHRESIAKLRRAGKVVHCKEGRKVWYVIPDHVIAFNRQREVGKQAPPVPCP